MVAQLNTDRLMAIGRNAMYFDDYVLSIQYFNQVIKAKPYLAEPYLYRAIAKIQLSDLSGAEKDCNIAIQNNPFLPGSYYARGFIYRQLGQNDTTYLQKAEADFSSALQFSPENKTYIMMRADTRAARKQYDQATEDIDYLLAREPHSASLHFERGTISLSKHDTIGALRSFTNAIQYDTQNASNWSARGLCNMMLEQDDDALLDFNKAIELGSHWTGDYINRGIIHYRKHNYKGALQDYDSAVEADPQNSGCYYNRALLRAEVGDYNRALSDLNKAIDLSPENTEIYYHRGLINLQLRQWQDAISDFETLISQYPYFLPSYYLAAQAYAAQNNPKQAYLYQQKAHKLEEDKERIQQEQQKVHTDVQIADNQPQKRDRRKEFSARAAQNQNETSESSQYASTSRGSVQKKYTDVINEPNILLSYYTQRQTIRRTNYFHYLVDQLNKGGNLPSPLYFSLKDVALTPELVNHHFEQITNFTEIIEQAESQGIDSQELALLYFARAIEFALVQDYSSALDDCTRSLNLQSELTLVYFCRANWRYKYLEYRRLEETYSDNKESAITQLKLDAELIMRDLDKVIELQPDFSFAYYNKANILCTQRDFRAAITYYNQAISIDPDFAEAYFNRGLTYIYTDLVEQGLDDLSKAGELGIYQSYNLLTRFK